MKRNRKKINKVRRLKKPELNFFNKFSEEEIKAIVRYIG